MTYAFALCGAQQKNKLIYEEELHDESSKRGREKQTELQ